MERESVHFNNEESFEKKVDAPHSRYCYLRVEGDSVCAEQVLRIHLNNGLRTEVELVQCLQRWPRSVPAKLLLEQCQGHAVQTSCRCGHGC